MTNNKNKTEVYKQLANLERRKYDMLLEIDKIQENIVNYQNILHDIDNIIKS